MRIAPISAPISRLFFTAFLVCSCPAWAQTASPVASPQASPPASPLAAPTQPGQASLKHDSKPDIKTGAKSDPKTDLPIAGQSATSTHQLIERIHVEGGTSNIDELRVGGETRSITVQPKGGMPAYDVQPVTGTRAWKVLGF